ncbi:hypothetical protein ACO0QE_004110 [Hanseniaspora vineae]
MLTTRTGRREKEEDEEKITEEQDKEEPTEEEIMVTENNTFEKPIILDALPGYLSLKNFDQNYKIITQLGTGSFGTVQLCKQVNDLEDGEAETFMNNHNSYYKQHNYHHQQDYKSNQFKYSMLNHHNLNPNNNHYNKKNKLVAIKTMMTRLDYLSDYSRVRELKFIFKIPAHQNLLTIYDCFIDSKFFKLHIAMEVMDQNLYQLIKYRNLNKNYFSLATLKSIISQILSGLYHIHENSFFHRDLKPENILISYTNKYFSKDYLSGENAFKDNYVIKIADYGLSRQVDPLWDDEAYYTSTSQSSSNGNSNNSGNTSNPNCNTKFTAYVSTRWYRSPEILLRNKFYSKPVDIWAFGCVIVEICTFKPLFPGSDELDQIWKILQMLGTPYLTIENQYNNYFPHGGVWEHCITLLKRLGLNFPYVEGFDIEYKISNPNLKKFCDVVKKCLVWNPLQRCTVEQLCELPYFNNTFPQLYHFAKKNEKMMELQQRKQFELESQFQHQQQSKIGSSVVSPIPIKASNGNIANQSNSNKTDYKTSSSLFNGLPTNALPIKMNNISNNSSTTSNHNTNNFGHDDDDNLYIENFDIGLENDGKDMRCFVDLYNLHNKVNDGGCYKNYGKNSDNNSGNNNTSNTQHEDPVEDNVTIMSDELLNDCLQKELGEQQMYDQEAELSPLKLSHGSKESIINVIQQNIDGRDMNHSNSNYTLRRPVGDSIMPSNHAFYVPQNPANIPYHHHEHEHEHEHEHVQAHVQDYIEKELNMDMPFPLDNTMT